LVEYFHRSSVATSIMAAFLETLKGLLSADPREKRQQADGYSPAARAGSGAAVRANFPTGGRGYRREAMTGLQGIRGGHYDASVRQPELLPGAYARRNFVDRTTGQAFDYLPGLATMQDLEFGVAATVPGGRPPRAFPVQDVPSFGPQLNMDQQISMIAQRRALGLDGRLPAVALVRDVSSDFNRPSDGRPSPYDAQQMQSAVNRIWTKQDQIDPRVAESAGQTIDSVTNLVAHMQGTAATPSPAVPLAGTAQFYSEHAYGSGGPRTRTNQFRQNFYQGQRQ
jgi:hypothetical protein